MMVGYGGTSKTGRQYHYYMCKNARRKKCGKKIVSKSYIEDRVVNECLKMLTEETIRFIAKKVAEECAKSPDNLTAKALKKAIREADTATENLWKAIEQGQALPWDFLCKMLLTALTLSAGFKGGEVVPSFYIGATFGCAFGPLLGLPAGFSAAVGLVSVFCGATNTLIPSILLAYELFGGVGLELIALGCGVCYMLSGTHGLYSSQLFVTEKLLSEYTESWGKRLRK